MSIHSCVICPHLKETLLPHGKESSDSKYGRMFVGLPPLETDEAILLTLGKAGSVMDIPDDQDMDERSDNPRIPAGFTFFGQFIAHDITADRSILMHHARLHELKNFRQPRLDLECLYGAGISGDPHLYDLNDTDKFLLGINDAGEDKDLPRNQQGRALVADPRNDVHLFIGQLHLAMLKFHNRVVDHLRLQGVAASDVFNQARQLVRWHYQWIIVNEFLPLTVGEELVIDIVRHGPRFYQSTEQVYIPIEFADAAYRYGHSQIRPIYQLNGNGVQGNVFPDCAGTCLVPAHRAIDWSYFFSIPGARPTQASKRMDTRIAHSLMDLPERVVGVTENNVETSLAYRDLARGQALDLPSGEEIARAIGSQPLSSDEMGLANLGWSGETPLWYYILKEAEVRHQGMQLGDVGGRIIAEVLLGLLGADTSSYWYAGKGWRPTLPAAQVGEFTMADLLIFAGAV